MSNLHPEHSIHSAHRTSLTSPIPANASLARIPPEAACGAASPRCRGNGGRRRVLGSIVFCLFSLLAAAEVRAVPYSSFENDIYELTPWEGTAIVVLTRADQLNPSTMSDIVGKLDEAWAVYADLTGRLPATLDATTLNERSTIAEVPDGETCGAGCAYLGFTGIEIMSTYWELLYDGVNRNDRYDQVLFYELGRNFWFYADQLGAVGGFTTGFAIANRFVSMAEIGVVGGPFNTLDFEEFRELATEELLAAYRADTDLDWRNTLGSGGGVPGQRFGGAADLAGAMMYRIYTDHGYEGYRSFWRETNDRPRAFTVDEAMANFIDAAYLATGQDYREPFKATDLPAPLPGGRTISIDIRPGNGRNPVNPRAGGIVRVAALSDVATPFDPLQIDVPTLRFGPDDAKAIRHRVKDINGDGLADLLLVFAVRATGVGCGDTVAALSGRTYGGQRVTGSDSIMTTGCGRGSRGVP